jgi:hypothetical protein
VKVLRAAATALLLLGACSERAPGTRVAAGLGRDLLVAPGGGAAAFLTDAVHPDDRTIPQDLVAGDLWLAAIPEQGAPVASKVGAGVSNAAGAVAFRSDGQALAFLASWRFRSGEGELWAAAPGAAPQRLAARASALAWSPRGKALAWVAGGELWLLRDPLGDRQQLLLASGVQSFSWSPDGTQLAAKAPSALGGKLWLVSEGGGTPRQVAEGSSDFLFAPDGALGLLGPAGPKGGDRSFALLDAGAAAAHGLGEATSFGFAPDGKELLLLSTDGTLGDAFGRLFRLGRGAEARRQPLGERVSEWRATPAGDLLVLGSYDIRARAGVLSWAPRAGAPRELAPRVQSFQLSPRGDRIFYLTQLPQKGDFKVELWTSPLPPDPAVAPRRVDEGVYGYATSPDGSLLYWKSRCQGSRSCVLQRARADGADAAVILALRVSGFDLSADGARLLVSHPHKGAARAVDLSLLDARGPPPTGLPHLFIEEVDPGSRFLDDRGQRVIAPLLSAHQPGVQVVALP